MSVLVNKNSRVIVQGFTGSEGSFHAGQMIEYGTNVVGGVTPGKGGSEHLGRPVFNTVKEAVEKTGADVSIIFVPPAFRGTGVAESLIKHVLDECVAEKRKVNIYCSWIAGYVRRHPEYHALLTR